MTDRNEHKEYRVDYADYATKVAKAHERKGWSHSAQAWRDARWRAVDEGKSSSKWGQR
jgi:hypothetical protein